MTTQLRIEEIGRADCLKLLQDESFLGRVAFILDGRPTVLPVNYLADESSIVFCTAAGTKLSALSDGAAVAFEVDQSRPLYHRGWSVVVHGVAREITDPDELDGLRRGPLRSWVTPASEHWVRISVDEISGRRVPEY